MVASSGDNIARTFFPPVSSIFLDTGREAVYRLSSSTATIRRSDGSGSGKCSSVWVLSCCGGCGAGVVVTAVGGGDTCGCSTSTAVFGVFVEYHTAPPKTTVEAARPIARLLIFIGGRDEPGIDPFDDDDCIEGSG